MLASIPGIRIAPGLSPRVAWVANGRRTFLEGDSYRTGDPAMDRGARLACYVNVIVDGMRMYALGVRTIHSSTSAAAGSDRDDRILRRHYAASRPLSRSGRGCLRRSCDSITRFALVRELSPGLPRVTPLRLAVLNQHARHVDRVLSQMLVERIDGKSLAEQPTSRLI